MSKGRFKKAKGIIAPEKPSEQYVDEMRGGNCPYIASTDEGTQYCTLNAPADYEKLKENQELAAQTIAALGLEILKQMAVLDAARNEIARLEQLIRDYYTVESFPTDQFIRLALGDAEARKLGIVIDVAEETRIAMENGWIEQ